MVRPGSSGGTFIQLALAFFRALYHNGPMQTLSLDTQFLYSDQPQWQGLSVEQSSAPASPETTAAFTAVENRLKSAEYGFVEVLKDQALA